MNAPENLGELNAMLAQVNIPQLTGDQFRALRENRPRQQLLTAASKMGADSGARSYVVKAIREIGVLAPGAENHGAEQATQTAPERAPHPASHKEAPAGPKENSDTSSDRFNYNMHIYGGKAALCFEPADTRGGDHTVSLDSATATAPRNYDWQNKLRLQMMRNELPVVAGVLLGLIPKCEYKNHGPNNDKGFSLEDQGSKVFIRTWAKDHPVRAVPVEPEDAYRVATLILRQMGSNAPWMGPSDIIQTIRMVVAR